ARDGDPALIKAIARGRAWFDELVTDRVLSLQALAERDGIAAATSAGLFCVAPVTSIAPWMERQLSAPFSCSTSFSSVSDHAAIRRSVPYPPDIPQIKAISSECGAILAPHFRAADGSLLRPARNQFRYYCQTVGKERPDIRRHSHEALRAPRSSGNGLRRQPA